MKYITKSDPPMMKAIRRFEFKHLSSQKFWEVHLSKAKDIVYNAPYLATVFWGKIGTAGSSNVYSFQNTFDRMNFVQFKIKEKLSKGYAEVPYNVPKLGDPIGTVIEANPDGTVTVALNKAFGIGVTKSQDTVTTEELAYTIKKLGLEFARLRFDATMEQLTAAVDLLSRQAVIEPKPKKEEKQETFRMITLED